MTEREYVETLKAAAEDYLDLVIRKTQPTPEAKRALKAWNRHRRALSAHTFLRLADAWLAANPSPAPADTKEPA